MAGSSLKEERTCYRTWGWVSVLPTPSGPSCVTAMAEVSQLCALRHTLGILGSSRPAQLPHGALVPRL